MLRLASGLAMLVLAVAGHAETVVEPEQCILATLKGSSAVANATAMVRYNCVRQYIRQVQPQAKPIPGSKFPDASASWRPPMQAFPNPIPAQLIVSLKNDTELRIITGTVAVLDKKTNQSQIYRLVADYPIDSFSVGTLSTALLPDPEAGNDPAKFWESHGWTLIGVSGVPYH